MGSGNESETNPSFDTKLITMVQIEPISQRSRDTKIDNILNLERVYILVTCVTSV